MYTYKNVVMFLTAFVFFFISCNQIDENEEILQIQETFNKYKTALLNNNGQEAIKYLNTQTLEYYSTLLSNIIFKSKREIEQLPLFDQYSIYFIKAYIGKGKILSFQNDEANLYIFLINSGLIDIVSLEKQSIENIKIDNYLAKANILINGSQTSMKYYFSKEDGQWKIDASPLLSIIKDEFSKKINNFKDTIDDSKKANIIVEFIKYQNPELSLTHIDKPFQVK